MRAWRFILIALALFGLEAAFTSHGILAAGGVVSMLIGSMILINSPWPGAGIRLSTSLAVTVPLAVITVLLVRFAWAAKMRKTVTGEEGLLNSVGVARTALDPTGKVFVHGEFGRRRSERPAALGASVKVIRIEGLTLVVEPVDDSR